MNGNEVNEGQERPPGKKRRLSSEHHSSSDGLMVPAFVQDVVMSADIAITVLIATSNRPDLLCARALRSVCKQNLLPRRVVVIVDDDDQKPAKTDLKQVEQYLQENLNDAGVGIHVVHNKYTKGRSGTGAWNTGIRLAQPGDWIAILDDDDEWLPNHLQLCAQAAVSNVEWVISGLCRRHETSGAHDNETFITKEPLPVSVDFRIPADGKALPKAFSDFLVSNPGVQGSNLFATKELFMRAGCFDEALSACTDRDICLRMLLALHWKDGEEKVAFTNVHTVHHYVENDRERISNIGSPSKEWGLRTFFIKWQNFMSSAQKVQFWERAEGLFGVSRNFVAGRVNMQSTKFTSLAESSYDVSHGLASGTNEFEMNSEDITMTTTSGFKFPLQHATIKAIQTANVSNGVTMINTDMPAVLVGMITSNLNRISGILDDLAALGSADIYITIFVNSSDVQFAHNLENVVHEKFRHCKDKVRTLTTNHPIVSLVTKQQQIVQPLPIAKARTVLQTYLVAQAQNFDIDGSESQFDGILVLDDDKRLPECWQTNLPKILREYCREDGCKRIFLGRDIGAAPNTVLASFRTQLLDLFFALGERGNADSRWAQRSVFEDQHDQYYDFSGSRSDHLEMPLSINIQNHEDLFESFFRGVPLSRDAVPASIEGRSFQRGGCMLVPRGWFELLLMEQNSHVFGHIIARRSDTLWVQHHNAEREIESIVLPDLYVIHDNRNDPIHSPSKMRELLCAEIMGRILCRPKCDRFKFAEQCLQDLHSWFMRMLGLVDSLNLLRETENVVEGVYEMKFDRFLHQVQEILNPEAFEKEVFSFLRCHMSAVSNWVETPTVFDLKDWDMSRWDFIHRARSCIDTSKPIVFVGMGSEGVIFKEEQDRCFKVFFPDVATQSLSVLKNHVVAITKLDPNFRVSSFENGVIQRTFRTGQLYRGGHGAALIQMLLEFKRAGLCFHNLKPDNIIVSHDDENHVELHMIDFGHDFDGYSPEPFESVCKRAFLSWQFGKYADTSVGSAELSRWMSAIRTKSWIPQLTGFDKFRDVIHAVENRPGDLDVQESELPDAKKLKKEFEAQADRLGLSADHIKIFDCDAGQPTEFPGPYLRVVVEFPFDKNSFKSHLSISLCRRVIKRTSLFEILSEDVDTNVENHRFESHLSNFKFRLAKCPFPRYPRATLAIRSCPQEYITIFANVQQIVRQLERADSFAEIVLVADWSRTDNFLRTYAKADLMAYSIAVERLEAEGVVDRVAHFGRDCQINPGTLEASWLLDAFASQVRILNSKYVGNLNENLATHATTGAPHASSFFAFEQCTTDIILMMDSDIFINIDGGDDFLADQKHLVLKADRMFSQDDKLVTCLPLPVYDENNFIIDKNISRDQFFSVCESRMNRAQLSYTDRPDVPFRYEVRFAFLHLARLRQHVFPLQRCVDSDVGLLSRPWYRFLDEAIKSKGLHSARGGVYSGRSFYVHPMNSLKGNDADYLLTMDRVANANVTGVDVPQLKVWHQQSGEVNVVETCSWFLEPSRSERLIFIICGRNVQYGRAMRCLESLSKQRGIESCGVILVDDDSQDADQREFLFKAASGLFGSRLTIVQTRKQQKVLFNLWHCVTRVCSNPNSIIVTLDMDDMLLVQDSGDLSVVEWLQKVYDGDKIDVTLGGMVRKEKFSNYSVDLENPRLTRGAGNVWQHLRSFRKSMFDSIPKEDFLVPETGKFIDKASDWAFMVPLVELAGPSRVLVCHLPFYLPMYFYEEATCIFGEKHAKNDAERKQMKEIATDVTATILFDRKPFKVLTSGQRAILFEKGTVELQRHSGLHRPSFCPEVDRHFATTSMPTDFGRDGRFTVFESTDTDQRSGEGMISFLWFGCICVAKDYGKCKCLRGASDVVVRIHSECFTGDVLHSAKCDCGHQLCKFRNHQQLLWDRFRKPSLLVYINGHEGRGTGLFTKIHAYWTRELFPGIHHDVALTDYAGAPSRDLRSFSFPVDVLKRHFSIISVQIWSNNPDKLQAFKASFGEDKVTQVNMAATETSDNSVYLKEKMNDHGHQGLLGTISDSSSPRNELDFNAGPGKKSSKGCVLVTGCAGFIGSHTSVRLLQEGYDVIGVDNLNNYYDPTIKRSALKEIKVAAEETGGRFSCSLCDIISETEMQKVFEEHGCNITHVCHLAAQAGVRYSIDNAEESVTTNYIGTLKVLTFVKDLQKKHGRNVGLTFASSSSVYGSNSTPPFSEEQHCNQPISPYAASKLACESLAYTYHHLYKMDIVGLRFFTVYGPRGRPDMATFKFIDRISKGEAIDKYGDGSAVREFTYIDDIVSGVVAAIQRKCQSRFETINLGGGASHTLNDLIATIEKHMNKQAVINQLPCQPGDVPLTKADLTKAQKILGFHPKTTLDEGIKRTVEWYRHYVSVAEVSGKAEK